MFHWVPVLADSQTTVRLRLKTRVCLEPTSWKRPDFRFRRDSYGFLGVSSLNQHCLRFTSAPSNRIALPSFLQITCGHIYAYLILYMLMKRTALFLKEQQLVKLQTLSRKTGAPIAELVRRAIDAYLLSRKNELK